MAESATLALDTILHRPTRGIPTGTLVHVMEHAQIDRLAGAEPGSYVREPDQTYIAMQHNLGVCLLDQSLAHNPLQMDNEGDKAERLPWKRRLRKRRARRRSNCTASASTRPKR